MLTDGALQGNSLDKLILLEEFKSCVSMKIKTYLEKQKVNELQRTATLADGYKLTHQSMDSNTETKGGATSKPKLTSSASLQVVDKSSAQPRDQDQSRGTTLRSGPVCAYCKQWGHLLPIVGP